MSGGPQDEPEIERDNPMIAAEYSLGLLEGEELLNARALVERDPQFAWRKDWWDNWFAPWTDEISGAEPDPAMWHRIESQLAEQIATSHNGGSETVIQLETSIRRWQLTAAFTSVAAVIAVALLAFAPGNSPIPAPNQAGASPIAAAAPLVASIPIGDTQLRLGVTYLPASSEMLLSASGLTADGVHDHELWLVPADGSALQSLGVIVPGDERLVMVPANIADTMDNGVQLVLTREPIGGKRDGEAAGPVVAEGVLSRI